MSRTRLIKPGFFTNDVLAEVSAAGRLLFAGLWTIADRAGRLEDRPKRIKAELLPFDSVNVDKLLDSLAERGFIARYESGGQRVIQIVSFARHQSPHPKEPPSKFPSMDESLTYQCLDTDKTVSSPASYLDPVLLDPILLDPASDDLLVDAPARGRVPRPRKRTIQESDIARWQDEHPEWDIPAFVADYLNWSGSSKHGDQVQGFENQMRIEWKCKQFARAGAGSSPRVITFDDDPPMPLPQGMALPDLGFKR